MKNSNVKKPDRIILFEIGIILALLAINYVLQLGYNNSFTLGPEAPDFSDTAFVYVPPQKKHKEIKQEFKTVKAYKALVFDPNALIKQVKNLFKVPETVMPKASLNKVPSAIPFLKTEPRVDTTSILDIIVSEMPQFPGGEKGLADHIRKNYTITSAMFDYATEVKMDLEFVIDRNGKVTNIKILTCSNPGLGAEHEAIRLYKNMPKWKPAKHHGNRVNIRLKQPLKIKIF